MMGQVQSSEIGGLFVVYERDYGGAPNAGPKARRDFEAICQEVGFAPIEIDPLDDTAQGAAGKLAMHARRARSWESALGGLHDTVVFANFPLLGHSLFHSSWLADLPRRNVRLVLMVHDLNTLRPGYADTLGAAGRLRINLEEKRMLQAASAIIVHNESMAQELHCRMGIDLQKMVALECFDYLAADGQPQERFPGNPIAVAGNLSAQKAGYAYQLPESAEFLLYGAPLDGEPAATTLYKGSIPADKLPNEMQGSFGLVWDGSDARDCVGVFGEYLAYNNPHKVSLYLAAGLPIIIWRGAAMARFVQEQGVGFAGDSIDELARRAKALSSQEYDDLSAAAAACGCKVRQGWFTKSALVRTLSLLLADEGTGE